MAFNFFFLELIYKILSLNTYNAIGKMLSINICSARIKTKSNKITTKNKKGKKSICSFNHTEKKIYNLNDK